MLIQPLLSICIPTYNRAELLRSALYNIVRQTAEFGDLVEVIVSDNASPDDTANVVEWSRQYGNVRYHRNAENIGGGRNFLQLAQKLATGKYCWLLGDDDLLHDNAVKEILKALTEHNEIDYVFVNNSYEDARNRKAGLIETTQNFFGSRYTCAEPQQRLVERWEQIISFANDGTLFTFIANHILRTEIWQQEIFEFSTDANFPSLEATFPHACIVARHMIGKRALYLGQPYIIAFLGAQDWHEAWPMIQLVRVLEFTELMAELGAEAAMVDKYRNLVMRDSSAFFWKLLTDKNTPGRKYFFPGHLCRNYWKYSGFYTMLLRYPTDRYIRGRYLRIMRLIARFWNNASCFAVVLSRRKRQEKT